MPVAAAVVPNQERRARADRALVVVAALETVTLAILLRQPIEVPAVEAETTILRGPEVPV
jgi:hypothetical protein